MKAAVCRTFGAPLAIEDVTIEAPGPNEVHVAVKACGVCHSDVLFADGGWGGALPAVYGHEAAGVVTATGAGVADLDPGDHVVVTLMRSCGGCPFCANDQTALCDAAFARDGATPLRDGAGRPIVQGLRTGAFAEAVVVDRSQVVAIPKDVPFAEASLLACGVLTGWGAVTNTARVRPGQAVAVVGIGGIGIASLIAARLAGADPILAVDIRDDKLALAPSFGATHTANAGGDDPGRRLGAWGDGRGFHHVLIAVGSPRAVEAGLAMLRPGGSLVLVGMPASGDHVRLDAADLAGKGQRILGSKMGDGRIDRDIPALITLYREGRLGLDALISRRYPLAGINEALASTRRGEALRNVIIVDQAAPR